MRVAVVGATGLVGSSVVAALRADPDKRVDSVLGLAPHLPRDPQPHVDWREVDLVHDDLEPHMTGVDALVSAGSDHAADGGGMEGVRRLFDAAASAGVMHLVQASSFAAYSPVPRLHDPVDEGWPVGGVADVPLARRAVAVERLLDDFSVAHEVIRVVRIRSGVVLGPGAAMQLRHYLERFSRRLRTPSRLPLLPGIEGAALPAVHQEDLAAAYRRAVTGVGRGPYNVALDTPLDLARAASALGARPVAVPESVATTGARIASRLLGRPADGWLALASDAPRLDTSRARHELGWLPVHSLDDALRSTVRGS